MSATKKPIKEMTIYQKKAGIRKMAEVIRKDKSGFNYKYLSLDEIMAHISPGLDKYHVILRPVIVPGTLEVTPISYTKVKVTKNGDRLEEVINEVLVKGEMTITWINLDNKEDQIVDTWVFTGQQGDASQALGSALSYALRYYLLNTFQIATPEDDPDNWRSKKMQAEAEEDRQIAKGLVEEIDGAVAVYLSGITDEDKLKEARTELTAVIKKYVRDEKGKPSGDYRLINDANTAATLLEAVKKITGGNAE